VPLPCHYHDLDAKCENLTQRGTEFSEAKQSAAVNGRRIVVDPEAVEGHLFEFVEYEPLS
jgi:hypothetical protein